MQMGGSDTSDTPEEKRRRKRQRSIGLLAKRIDPKGKRRKSNGKLEGLLRGKHNIGCPKLTFTPTEDTRVLISLDYTRKKYRLRRIIKPEVKLGLFYALFLGAKRPTTFFSRATVYQWQRPEYSRTKYMAFPSTTYIHLRNNVRKTKECGI